MTRECGRPLPDAALFDWWTGESSARERRLVDEHLLDCEGCYTRARVLAAIASGVSSLVRGGLIRTVITARVIDKMRLEGKKVREYHVPTGGGVHCTLAPEDDFLVARLEARVEAGARLDLLSRVGDGPEFRVEDVPFIPGAGEVIVAQPVDEIRARPPHVERIRLVGVTAEGERAIGEFTFNHTPWPGPGPSR